MLREGVKKQMSEIFDIIKISLDTPPLEISDTIFFKICSMQMFFFFYNGDNFHLFNDHWKTKKEVLTFFLEVQTISKIMDLF